MTVWVTRDEPSDGPLSRALRCVGLSAVVEPVIHRHIVADITSRLSLLTPDDWLVLTSVWAIETLPIVFPVETRIAVVGRKSDRAATRRGLRVDLVSPTGTANGLFEALRARASHDSVICYPRSSRARPPAPWTGVVIDSPVYYETRLRDYDRSIIERVDVVAVTSPSTVQGVGVVPLPYASIGPVTSRAVIELGLTPRVEARRATFGELATGIARHRDWRGCMTL